MVKNQLQNNKLRNYIKSKVFECKNVTDYDTEPYHLQSTIIVSWDVVNPNPVV